MLSLSSPLPSYFLHVAKHVKSARPTPPPPLFFYFSLNLYHLDSNAKIEFNISTLYYRTSWFTLSWFSTKLTLVRSSLSLWHIFVLRNIRQHYWCLSLRLDILVSVKLRESLGKMSQRNCFRLTKVSIPVVQYVSDMAVMPWSCSELWLSQIALPVEIPLLFI